MKVTRTRLAAVGLIAAAAIAGSLLGARDVIAVPSPSSCWSPTAPTSPCRRPSQGRRPSTWAGL